MFRRCRSAVRDWGWIALLLMMPTLVAADSGMSTPLAWWAMRQHTDPAGAEHTDHDHHHDHGHDAAGDQSHAHTDDTAAIEPAPSAADPRRLLPLLGVYSLLVVTASLIGGAIPGRVQLSHTQFQVIISLVGGLMLGIGLLHLFPHAVHEMGSARLDAASGWMLAGVLLMFFLLRTFHFHHHEPDPAMVAEAEGLALQEPDHPLHDHAHDHDHDHDHGAACDHDHEAAAAGGMLPETPGCHHAAHGSRLGWIGIFIGLGLHTVLDGIALGAAMQADAAHGQAGFWGLGILLAIVLHKPLDALSITTLMLAGGWPLWSRTLVNLAFASLCPIGALLFVAGVQLAGTSTGFVVGAGLAFSAGAFICIALADLLPEMQFHSHHRLPLSIALLTGVALAWGIGFLEPSHLH